MHWHNFAHDIIHRIGQLITFISHNLESQFQPFCINFQLFILIILEIGRKSIHDNGNAIGLYKLSLQYADDSRMETT